MYVLREYSYHVRFTLLLLEGDNYPGSIAIHVHMEYNRQTIPTRVFCIVPHEKAPRGPTGSLGVVN